MSFTHDAAMQNPTRSGRTATIITVILLAISSLLAWLALEYIKINSREQLFYTLTKASQVTKEALDIWVDKKISETELWAENENIQLLAKQLIDTSDSKKALLNNAAQARFRLLLSNFADSKGFVGMQIITPDYQILASRADADVGEISLLAKQDEFFRSVLAGHSRLSLPLFLPEPQKQLPGVSAAMFVCAPVKDSSGTVIAVLAFQINPAGDFSRITRLGRIGATGGTYLFDSNARLITSSHFESQLAQIGLIQNEGQSILSVAVRDPGGNLLEGFRPKLPSEQLPLTAMAASAITGEFGSNLEGYHDYRGIDVIGVWDWDHKMGYGISTEIESAEAYEAYYKTQQLIISIFAIMFLLSVGLFIRANRIHRLAEEALREREERIRLLLDSTAEAIYGLDMHGLCSFANSACLKLLGYNDVSELMDRNMHALIHHSHADGSPYPVHECLIYQAIQKGKGAHVFDEVLWHKDGHCFPVEYWSYPICKEGEVVGSVVTFIDISERLQAEEKLRQSAVVFDTSREAVVITDKDGKIVATNKAYLEISGFQEEDALGKNPSFMKSELHDAKFYRTMWRSIRKTGEWHGEVWNRHKSGKAYPAWLGIRAVEDEAGRLNNYIAVFSDLTVVKQSQEKLAYQANHDPLTDLPNRKVINDRLEHAFECARRDGSKVAVLFLDVDRFKAINDSLGYKVGDKLLQQLALRLKALLREEDTIGRLVGDEFIIIMEGLIIAQDAAVLARKLIDSFDKPFQINGHELFVNACVGISIYPDDGNSVSGQIANADVAMFKAKKQGPNTYLFYTSDLTVIAVERGKLESQLHHALEQNELSVHYQAQSSLQSGALIGAEALVRWNHPELGLLSPGKFVAIAEKCGLIIPIGEWVMRTACKQMAAWQNAGFDLCSMAVNIAGSQMHRIDLVSLVRDVLEESGLEPQYLELEVTEGFLMREPERTINLLHELRSLGIRLAIDDFGTGYSSLSYLKQFPIDKLKIDQAFVRHLKQGNDEEAIVRAVIALGRSLGLKVIAEGVETTDQESFLRDEGCNEGQGYLYSRPIVAAEFAKLDSFKLIRVNKS